MVEAVLHEIFRPKGSAALLPPEPPPSLLAALPVAPPLFVASCLASASRALVAWAAPVLVGSASRGVGAW
jgi:hypothetical protein